MGRTVGVTLTGLKTAEVYVNLYQNLLQMSSKREITAREVLES